MIEKELRALRDELHFTASYGDAEAIHDALVKLIDIVRSQQAKIESLETKIALLVYSE